MRGEDQRRGDAGDEIQHHLAVWPAEDAVFVLQPDRVDTAFVDPPGGLCVGLRIVARDRRGDACVVQRLARIVERIDVNRDLRMVLAQLLEDVGCEGGDAALARREIADQRNPAGCGDLGGRNGEDRPDRTPVPGGSLRFVGVRVEYHRRSRTMVYTIGALTTPGTEA